MLVLKLQCENMTMQFGDKTALNNVEMLLEPGSLIGLVGANGAGKSTLLKLMATLLKPTQGNILLDGQSIVNKPNIMRSILGYLPQSVPIYPNLSAAEYLLYLAAAKGIRKGDAKKQIAQLLVQFHLEDTGKRPLSAFSGGMRQRVGLCAALLGNPQIIIVDEPTAGLDPQERVNLRNMLSELSRERIVVLSTHIVSDIEAVAGQILLLRKGQLAYDGTPENLIAMAEGRVWEYVLPHGALPPEGSVVSSLVQTAHGVCVREVADSAPSGALSVTATLEDACLALLRGGAGA